MVHKKFPKNISEIIRIGEIELEKFTPTPRLESEILLAFVLKKGKEFLYANFEERILLNKFQIFIKNINKRKLGFPIAYILGKKEFYGSQYLINRKTLIPRSETEGLIEIVIEKVTEYFGEKEIMHILEIGTGSGCISITLKKLLRQKVKIDSYEISKRAFSQAILNYRQIKPGKINFINMDAFKENILRKYDLIVSNPPYLSKKDMQYLNFDVTFEPKTALYGGVDGLLYYRKLFKLMKRQLKKNGIAVFEINENLGEKTAAIFQKEYSCEIIKDQFNKDRYIMISPR